MSTAQGAGRASKSRVSLPTGTVTFLFTDIEGSTQRWDRNRAAMEEAVRVHDRLMREAIASYGGHIFKTVGDAFCAAFAMPESAVGAALEAQRALGALDFSAVDGMRVRMAINTGTADERDGDYFGSTVNRVARLLSIGHGGQVLLSGIAADLVRENPPPQASLADLGAHALKDLERHEQVYQLVAPGLQRDFPELRAQRDWPWLVPNAVRTRYFTGREDLLALLRRQLVERHRAALSGLGGVGKTQAAIEYAVRHRTDYPDGIFWINAETANGLTSGFVEIAKALRLTAAESNDQEQVVRAVLERLNATDRWLLILDNVDDRGQIQRFVPERGKGDVLITSRESVFQELGIARGLEVKDLDGNEALQFLLKRTGREDSDLGERAAAAELAAELGNLPLALEQAAAYMTETSASFFNYLGAFRKRRVTLLEKAVALVSHDTVAATWAANFEAVERASPAAADVLRISAFLAPDAIPFEILLKGAQALGEPIASVLCDPDELAMGELLRPLSRYSLVRSDAKSNTYGLHRLVQEIVRAATTDAECRKIVELTIAAINAALPEVEFAVWAQCDRLVPHVAAVARWVDTYGIKGEAVARILNDTGRYLTERGRYGEAEPLLVRALAIRENLLGKDHPDVAVTVSNLAIVYLTHGRYSDARSLHERSLRIRERALGTDHPHVAGTLSNLGNVYWHEGRYAEALPLYERALAIWEGALGPDSMYVATGLNNVAAVLTRKGAYAEAQALNERALAIRERALGPDHPHVALSLNNLAELSRVRARFAEAESLLERALAIRERELGSDHLDVAESLNNLGGLNVEQGRYADAQRLYERALAISERAVGPDHPELTEILNGLADAHLKQGRHDEAKSLYERAFAIGEHGFGPDSPSVALSLDGLARVYAIQGRYTEAESLYERARMLLERALGSDHPDVAKTLVGLASLRQEQGRTDEAIALFERAHAIKARTHIAAHPELAEIRNTLEALRSASTSSSKSKN